VVEGYRHELRGIELDEVILATPFGVQTRWHVIAGAQSSGKTTLIGQLADRGFKTVPEGARLHLEAVMAQGRTAGEIRANPVPFQRGIVETQLRLEGELRPAEVAFLDRGVPECLAWWRVYGLDPNEFLGECFRHRYATVFFLDRLPVHDDGLRPRDEALADFIDEWTRRDYAALGYSMVRVPVMSPEERLAFVLESVSEDELT
jgi:predicted ATPase